MKFPSRVFHVAVLLTLVFVFSAWEVKAEDQPNLNSREGTGQCEKRYCGFALGLTYASQIPLNRSQKSSVDFFLFRAGPVIRLATPRRAIFESFELLSHGVIGGSVHPRGTVVGFEPVIRTNFSPIGKNTIFADWGMGVNYLSAADPKLPEITGRMQFSLRADVGLKRPFGENGKRSWFIAIGILHYSNAGIKKPNQGVNTLVASFGLTF